MPTTTKRSAALFGAYEGLLSGLVQEPSILPFQQFRDSWGIFGLAQAIFSRITGRGQTLAIRRPGGFIEGSLDTTTGVESSGSSFDRLPEKYKALITAEQVRLLYQNTATGIAGALAALAIVIVLMVGVVPNWILFGWATVIGGPLIYGFWIYLHYARASPGPNDVAPWITKWCMGSVVAGLLWGVGNFVLMASSPTASRALLLLIMGLVATGSVASYSSYLPGLYSFLFPLILTVTFSLVMQANVTYYVLALGFMFLGGILITFARNFNQALTQALVLSLRNSDLITQLTLKNEEAEKANLAKTRFLAAASHDLRQPMHAMGLFVGALREKIRYPQVRELVDKIQASVNAMDDLFNGLLDISRLDAGTIQPELGDFSLGILLQRMELQYGPQAREKGLVFKVVSTRAVVRSDPVHLDRIVRNLVSNAVRYTARGGVLLGCRRKGRNLSIEIHDTGPGIPAEHLEDIFQEFYQLGNPERDRSKGLGLGLSIVKRLAELLGHRVSVISRVGKGARFAVEVPLGFQPERVERPALGAAAAQSDPVKGAFVAVVDDESDILIGTEALLTQWGCHVLTAASGDEALRELERHERTLDLIISDFRLRDQETGVDVINRIRAAQEQPVPALLITGDSGPQRLREAATSGIPVIHKPISADELRAVMAKLLAPAPSDADGAAIVT